MEDTDSKTPMSSDAHALLALFFERARPARVVYPVAALCMAVRGQDNDRSRDR